MPDVIPWATIPSISVNDDSGIRIQQQKYGKAFDLLAVSELIWTLSNISSTYSIPSTIRIQFANSTRGPTFRTELFRGPPPLPKIPSQRGLQELRDSINESHELDNYNCGLSGTRELV